MSSYKTEAIVLHRFNLGESDRVMTLFSPMYGLIKMIAKGSRKTKSKYSGHTELFTKGDFVVSTGKNLDILADAMLINNYLAKTPDIESVKSAYYFGEVLTRLLPDREPHTDLYELLDFCLSHILTLGPELMRLVFVARLLKTLGVYPELNTCVKCGKKPDNEQIYFSQSAGGILDSTCSLHFTDSTKTNEEVVKVWRFVADTTIQKLLKLNIAQETLSLASELAVEYIRCATQIDYRSLRVLS